METLILWGESPFVFVKTVSSGGTCGLDEALAVATAGVQLSGSVARPESPLCKLAEDMSEQHPCPTTLRRCHVLRNKNNVQKVCGPKD